MAYNYYLNDLQGMRDRIDAQIRQFQNQQPAPITQNFQITPTQSELESKYANDIEDVKNTFVMKTGIFATKDFSTIWVKDVTGTIKTYKTEEVIELDDKDKMILDLQRQINELKGERNESNVTNANGSIASKKPTKLSDDKSSND